MFESGLTKAKEQRTFWRDRLQQTGVKLNYDGIPYDGIPYIPYECKHGPDRNKAVKAKKLQSAWPEIWNHCGRGDYSSVANKLSFTMVIRLR